ncbi:MAG: nitrite reductase small subunit NirD [Sulfuricella sp.]|nr:nitrite reductase small subunit NirD [Sulfuricella sp.]
MTDWTKICALEEIPRLGSRVLESAKGRIALFRTETDELFALQDRCPHKGGHLSQGIVCGSHVTCPMHGWNIALQEGRALAPDVGETAIYQVRVENGAVFVLI